jgi:hypothetical protein
MWSSQPELASSRLDRAEPAIVASGDAANIGRLHHSRGNIASWGFGRPADSLGDFRMAHQILAAAGDRFAAVPAIMECYMSVRVGQRSRAAEVLEFLESPSDVRRAGPLGTDMVRGLLALQDGEYDLADIRITSACEMLDAIGAGVLAGPGYSPLVWSAALAGDAEIARQRAERCFDYSVARSGGWRVGDACAAFGVAEIVGENPVAASAWFQRGLLAGCRAPEADVVIWSAAGLVETGEWSSEERRGVAASLVRTAIADVSLEIPPGARKLFPRVSAAVQTGASLSVNDLVASVRDVLNW